jgi:Cupin domain.
MNKIEIKDAREYPTTGHFDMKALRLHGIETSNCKDFTLSLSHFLPDGGTDYMEGTVELIYFILEGELTIRTKTEAIVLKKYDSMHFNIGDTKSIKNETNLPASMLVIAGMRK